MERNISPSIVIPIPPSKSRLLNRCMIPLGAYERLLLIIFLSSPLLLQPVFATEMTSFNYPNFKDYSCISVQGNASVEGTGAIQLTNRDMHKSVGLAYYCHPIHLWNANTGELANFTTTFTFGVTVITSFLGGGVTFFLSEDPTIPPDGRGDCLGLVNSLTASEGRRFVAVEFDSWHNDWDPLDSSCHVGIDINSIESVEFANMYPNAFRAGPQGKAQVAYSSVSKNLSVSLDYNYTIYELSYIVDLRSELPERVYVGFSLATDVSKDPKNITSWSFAYSNLHAPKESSLPPFNPNSSNNNSQGTSPMKKTGVLVAAIVLPLLVILIIGVLCFFLLKFKKAKYKDEIVGETPVQDPPLRYEHDYRNAPVNEEFDDGGARRIPFKHLVDATDNFHYSRRLGKGAFGGVYHGFLKDLNREVAIKRIAEYSEHGEKEFAAEVKTISRSRHRNLVQLIGCCREGCDLLLVYEFMPNGSLDFHLFDNGDKVLWWPRRRNIALGIASALQYLHEELDKCIVHRDIKSSNILLDGEFNAKLGDFGLARIADHGSALQSTMMAGTMGYMAPEYLITCKASKEADVYSYGIVALELVSGRRAVEPREKGRETLIHWIWELYGKGTIMDAVDKKLGTAFNEQEAERLMRVGMWCAHPEAHSRPSFRQVISALNFEIAVPDMKINPSNIAQLPFSLVSGMSSSTKSSDDYNDGKSNSWQVNTSTSGSRG